MYIHALATCQATCQATFQLYRKNTMLHCRSESANGESSSSNCKFEASWPSVLQFLLLCSRNARGELSKKITSFGQPTSLIVRQQPCLASFVCVSAVHGQTDSETCSVQITHNCDLYWNNTTLLDCILYLMQSLYGLGVVSSSANYCNLGKVYLNRNQGNDA